MRFHSGIVRDQAEYWNLERLKKYSSHGVVRSVPPRVTIRKARQKLGAAGVTRVSDVTLLDCLGIPNFMSVRPKDRGPGISYYNGKGITKDDAHAGALMEAIERHAGEYCDYKIVTGSYNELRKTSEIVSPREIIVPKLRPYSDDLTLEWVRGYDLINDQPTLTPLNCVVTPYESKAGVNLFYSSSNGLASGNSLTEALCHALCEIVERDAESMSLTRTRLAAGVSALLSNGNTDDIRKYRQRTIALDSLPLRANRLISKMKHAGLEVLLDDLTDESNIATIQCTIVDPGWNGPTNAHGGCGAHPDSRVALLRALTEAAQSRLTCIQGGREDLAEIMANKSWVDLELVHQRQASAEVIGFPDIPSSQNEYIDDDIRFVLHHLKLCGLLQVIAFDLTRPEVGLPVVRVVVPRAESWAVFHIHTGRGALGPRCAEALCHG